MVGRRRRVFAAGVCLSATLTAGTVGAATHTPADAEALLSEDGFGTCVPEEHLDDIWLAYATKADGGRVPHVCMTGTCEDLPEIATWAAAQQYPEDVDLEREDVVTRYADFVADFCAPPPETAAPAEPAPDTGAPALARSLSRLLSGLEIRPDVPAAGGSAVPPFIGAPGLPVGGGSRITQRIDPDPVAPPTGPGDPPPVGPPPGPSDPFDPFVPDREVTGDPEPPTVPRPPAPPPPSPPPPVPIPLPAGLWLLASALGLGWWWRRRGARG